MIFVRYLVATIGLTVLLPSLRAQSVESERARIEKTRQQLQALFAVEDEACHQKFAVNSCLNEINTKRREAIADLRRQEISLNDDERRKRGAEQVRRVEEKLSVANRQVSSDRRDQIFSEYTDRTNREQESKRKKEERALASQLSTVPSPTETRIRKKQVLPDALSTFSAVKANQYHERQSQARERREKHEAVTSKRPPSTAKPLPLPP